MVLGVECFALRYELLDDCSCVVSAECELFAAAQGDGCGGSFCWVGVTYEHGVPFRRVGVACLWWGTTSGRGGLLNGVDPAHKEGSCWKGRVVLVGGGFEV